MTQTTPRRPRPAQVPINDADDDTEDTRSPGSKQRTESAISEQAADGDATDEDTVGDSQNEESDEAQQLATAYPNEAYTPTTEAHPEEGSDIASPVESIPTVQDANLTAATSVAATEEPASDPVVPVQPGAPTTEAPSAAVMLAPESTEATAPAALAAVTAAAAPDDDVWLAVTQRALNRLMGWPGTPRNFVDLTNYQTDQTLDSADDQLDSLATSAPVGSPAQWLPDLINLAGAFFIPAVPNFTFTDSLNALGDFLNRVVPPFDIAPGAGALDVISPYKIMGAAVVGTATVLDDMLNGIYDPAQWEIHVIKATTGADVTESDLNNFTALSAKVVVGILADGGAYMHPERAWEVTLPTWTADQVNPFTIGTYVALVGIYKRFQEMAVLTTFTTSTTYESWLYTIGSGSSRSQYAAGSFHAVDPDGRAADFFGVSQGGTFTSEGGALVTINTADGGYTYTNTLPGAAFFQRANSENEADRYDTVSIPVTSADGVEYTLQFKIQILGETNSAPGSSYNQNNNTIDALGVVRGSVAGTDSDGDTLTYSLVGSSVNGLTGNSAYTKNGVGNGGIVTLNPGGTFTYVSTSTAGTSQSFQVQMTDGHGGSTITTIAVQNVPTLTPANVNTSTPYVVTGSVPASTNLPGVFTGYTLSTAPTKGTVTSFNPATGAFTYTSSAGRVTTNDDVVTVIATDANGRTVTLRLAVKPSVGNSAPVGTGVTTSAPVGSPTYNPLGGPSDEQNTTGTLHASDADGDTVTFAAGTYTTANGGSITVNANGTFTYDKNVFAPFGVHDSYWHDHAVPGDPGDTFTVNVSDAYGATTAVTYSIPIATLNAVPTLAGTVNGTPGVDALGVRRGTINGGSDGDGDGLTYSLVNATGGSAYTTNGGIVTMNGTSFTYIPKVGVTSDSFQVQVNDGHGGTATATVNLTGLTTPGTATNAVRTTLGTETGTLSIPTPSDTTDLGLTYSVDTDPLKGTVQLVNTNGTYTYTYVRNPVLGHSTSVNDSFTIKATDATGKSVTVATINVAPQDYADAAPVVVSNTTDAGSTDTNKWALNTSTWTQKTTGKITATDADGDTLTYSLVNPTTNAPTTTTTNGGTVTFNADGSYTYTIAKSANSGRYFHYAATTTATGGTLTSTSDTTTRASIDTFGVAVSDGFGGVTYTTVTIPIYAYNQAPTISNGLTGIKGFTDFTSVTGSATDGDSVGSLSITKQPEHGSATYSAQVIRTDGSSDGDTVELTITETNSYKVVNGIVQVGTLSSATKRWIVGSSASSAVYV